MTAEQVVERRPWGTFEVLAEGEGYKVKRITVNPGQRLSLQRHAKRTETWSIISGKARGNIGPTHFEVDADENDIDLHVGIGEWHRIGNGTFGNVDPLVFIEVQRGEYLGEDDIERMQDDYGRA